MIDSLTVSVLLFVALAIGAVVVWDAWRAWRLRKLAVRPPQSPLAQRDDAGAVSSIDTPVRAGAIAGRGEPSLGFDAPDPAAARLEPELTLGERESDQAEPAPPPRHQTALPLGEPSRVPMSNEPGIAGQALPGSISSASTGPGGDESTLLTRDGAAHREAGGNDVRDRAPASSFRQILPDPPAASEIPGGGDPATAGRVGSPETASAAGPASTADGVITQRTDCIAMLRFMQPVSCERLLASAQSLRRVGSKPVLLEVAESGLPEAAWLRPRSGRSAAQARFGLLLANRLGPLNALEYTDFAQQVRDISASLGVGVELPDMSTALAWARELDAESAQLDATICLNVDAGEVLGPSQLAALAGPLSISERGNNRYARLGGKGETIFSVSLGERSNRLSFLLDIPRVDPRADAFAAMLESARVASRRLPGRLVDDEGRTLTERSLEQIARGIEQRQQALAAAGLAAGTSGALRVFN